MITTNHRRIVNAGSICLDTDLHPQRRAAKVAIVQKGYDGIPDHDTMGVFPNHWILEFSTFGNNYNVLFSLLTLGLEGIHVKDAICLGFTRFWESCFANQNCQLNH